MQNSIYKIKYLLFLSWDWEAWCLTQPGGGNTPPPERNTAWNKGRKWFHCLGAPNNSPLLSVMNITFSKDKLEELIISSRIWRVVPLCSILPSRKNLLLFHELSAFNQIRAKDMATSQPRTPLPLSPCIDITSRYLAPSCWSHTIQVRRSLTSLLRGTWVAERVSSCSHRSYMVPAAQRLVGLRVSWL